MSGAKPRLFVGVAVLLNKKGQEDKGEKRFTAVCLNLEKDPPFGQSYMNSELAIVLSKAKIMRKSCGKVTFEPPPGVDVRGGNAVPRRYEALELKDINRAQVVLGLC